jgi:glycosyltransferase involved in cell wall biosynthesis
MSVERAACVVLLPTRLFGGHQVMLLEWLSKAVAQHGLRVQIYSAPNEHLIRACGAAGLGRPIISHPPEASGLRDFIVTWRLLGRIPADVPVLFAPGVLQTPLLQWLAALLRRRRLAGYVPMAYSSRRMRFRGGSIRDWIVGLVVRRVDLWITISDQQRQLLTSQWRVKSPVLVVSNRLAIPRRAAPPARQPVQGALRVLFAGRFEANQKGLDWLCDRLRARRGEWTGQLRFVFRGEGDFACELLRLSRDLRAGQVEVQPWGDAGQAMREADVLLLPSRFEGVPLVALEATQHGLPVVASRCAGVSELLPASCLFDFGDEDAMWSALRALRSPARRAAALAHSRGRVERLLSPASFRREIEQVVDALARMRRPAHPAGKPSPMEGAT